MARSRRARAVLVACAALAVAASACDASSTSKSASSTAPPKAARAAEPEIGATTDVRSADNALTLETTSTRAAFVSGGDVLVTLSGDAADDRDAHSQR